MRSTLCKAPREHQKGSFEFGRSLWGVSSIHGFLRQALPARPGSPWTSCLPCMSPSPAGLPSHPHPQGPLHPVIPYLCPELSLLHSFIPQIFTHRLQRARPCGGKLLVSQTEGQTPVFGALLLPVGDRPRRRMTQLPQHLQGWRWEETGCCLWTAVWPSSGTGPISTSRNTTVLRASEDCQEAEGGEGAPGSGMS